MKQAITISVALSEDQETATVRMSSQSTPIVCGVLGVEAGPDGERIIYLDRRIHRRSNAEYRSWYPRGAISTILTEVVAT